MQRKKEKVLTTPTTPTEAKAADKDKKQDEKNKKVEPVLEFPKPHNDPVPVHVKEKSPTKITFTPRVWAKVCYMRDRGKTEISGMGVSSVDDPFLIEDFKLIKQYSCSIFTEFEDKALANFVEDMAIDHKIGPARCFRVWIHTHPNMSSSPSGHDEDTFKRVNGQSTWGVMCVVANETETARLVVHNEEGMSGETKLSVVLGLHLPFEGVTAEDYKAWDKEYCDCVVIGTNPANNSASSQYSTGYGYGAGCYDQYSPHYGWEQQAWGGDERFSEGSIDEEIDFYLSNEEHIQSMGVEVDGFYYVYTNGFWFQYGNAAELFEGTSVGDHVVSVNDLSQFPPHDWGHVDWKDDGTPILYARDGTDHDLNDLRAEVEAFGEMMADAEEAEEEEEEEEETEDVGEVVNTGP